MTTRKFCTADHGDGKLDVPREMAGQRAQTTKPVQLDLLAVLPPPSTVGFLAVAELRATLKSAGVRIEHEQRGRDRARAKRRLALHAFDGLLAAKAEEMVRRAEKRLDAAKREAERLARGARGLPW